MGSFASAAFIQSVYDGIRVTQETDLPSFTYIADPSLAVPWMGHTTALNLVIKNQIKYMSARGVSDLVVCCLVAHAEPLSFNGTLHSVSEIARDLISAQDPRHTVILGSPLLTKDADLQNALFGRTLGEMLPKTREVERFSQIYDEVRLNRLTEDSVNFFRQFAEASPNKTIILCCSELHVLTRELRCDLPRNVIDPLAVLSRRLAELNGATAL
jgi:aspartate/glutamate racemase